MHSIRRGEERRPKREVMIEPSAIQIASAAYVGRGVVAIGQARGRVARVHTSGGGGHGPDSLYAAEIV